MVSVSILRCSIWFLRFIRRKKNCDRTCGVKNQTTAKSNPPLIKEETEGAKKNQRTAMFYFREHHSEIRQNAISYRIIELSNNGKCVCFLFFVELNDEASSKRVVEMTWILKHQSDNWCAFIYHRDRFLFACASL